MTCQTCHGRKRVIGAGFMMRDCFDCATVESSKPEKIHDDFKTLADAYEQLQTENEKLKERLAQYESLSTSESPIKPAQRRNTKRRQALCTA